MENKDNLELNRYVFLSILIIAILLLVISSIATLNLEDLFGSEPNVLDRKNKAIAPSDLRKEINKINDGRYLHQVNTLLAEHFAKTLKSQYYLSTFYYRNKDEGKGLKSTEFTSEKKDNKMPIIPNDLIDSKTLRQRNKPEFQDKDKIAWVHTVGDHLIKAGKLKSISLWIAEQHEKYNGILAWRSGPSHTILRHKEDPNRNRVAGDISTLVINLSEIVFKDKNIKILPEGFESINYQNEELWFEKIKELEENATFGSSMQEFLAHFSDEEQMAVKYSLIHFRMDAEMYPKGSYYRYWINPYKTVSETYAILMVKVSSFLGKNRIGQLRDLLTMIVMEKGRIKLKEAQGKINEQNRELLESNDSMAIEAEHYKKHEINAIKTRMLKLSGQFPEIGKTNEFIYAKIGIDHLLDVSSFYVSMMKREAYETTEINVKAELNTKLNTILNSLDLLGLKHWHIENIQAKEQVYRNITENINNRIHVKFNPIAFQIIVMELIKNGIQHSNKENPSFTIQWSDSENAYYLEFINNSTVSDEQLDYINDSMEIITIQHKVSGGIRSIKRILQYYGNTGWKMGAKRNSEKTNTIVYISIPKGDISFGTPSPDNDIINF